MGRKSRSRSPVRERSRYSSTGERGKDDRRYRSRQKDSEDLQRRRGNDDDDRNGRRDRHRDSYGDSPRQPERRSRERRDDRRRDRSKEREQRRDDDGDRYRDRNGGRDRYRQRDDTDRQEGPSTSRRSHANSPAGSRARSRSPSGSASAKAEKDENKGKPNFKPSGLLAAATNSVKLADGTSTVLKYNEPPEARNPTKGWRLYVFKGEEQSDPLHINRQSCYLIGRDKAVTEIFVEHPSCSKQHAAIQYRQVKDKNEFGEVRTSIKPFIIDLESTNGTLVNDEKIPAARYYEIMAGDVLKFGQSTREYVLMSDDV